MLTKIFSFLFICLIVSISSSGQAPDLDRIIANITVAAPPVEALDNAAIQLHYFDSVAPTAAQEKKMMEAYKALSAGFAANVHYKQGYNVFQKYLNLKEKIMADEKAGVIQDLQNEYRQKDKTDEDKVVNLQNEVSQLNMDADGFISKRSGFKNIFSIVIVALSILFAASLFRSGVRLRSLNAQTKANQEIIRDNHRIVSLGYLAEGIPAALASEKVNTRKYAADVLQLVPEGLNEPQKSALKDIMQTAQ